jgi:D-3-phosphoglycerate dehydrogenase
MKILANDGVSQAGVEMLQEAGHEVIQTKVAQEQLSKYMNDNNVEVLLVRSATKVRKDLIDACPGLKIIGRGGVGLDNIDVDHAKSKGIHVINTPAASSDSVAELVMAHALSGFRFLHQSNREMPLEGESKFKDLKKAYAKGVELKGKTMGIVGMGRIGQAVARCAIGMGMNVVAHDKFMEEADVKIEFYDGQHLTFKLKSVDFDKLLAQSDVITFHVPAQKDYILGKAEIEKMKDGAAVINTARGGVIDEKAVVDALESGKLKFAAIDVFEKEPTPEVKLLMQSQLSLSPHIGGATNEAQSRIGTELAQQIIDLS